MNDKIITGRALNALAAVIAEVRRRAGGTDWQEPGILDALARATDHPRCTDAGALVLAATRAANDGSNRTPAVIALDGKHWDERLREPQRAPTSGPTCAICPRCRRAYTETDHRCVTEADRVNRATVLAEAKRVAAEARGEYERAMGTRAEVGG